jgi:hypothetical protein
MVEGASQGDQGQMRGMEDTALVRGGFDFDIGRHFSKGDFSLTSIADAKPANGMLGPTFMGMVMRLVVVVGGPITPVARGWAARGPSCLVMIVLICRRVVKGHMMISVVQNN